MLGASALDPHPQHQHQRNLARREVTAVANALIAWEVQRSSSALDQGATVLSDNIDSIERTLESGTSNGQPLTSAQRTGLQTLLAQRTRERDSVLVRIDARVTLGLLSPLAEPGVSVTAVHPGALPKMLLSGAFAFVATLAAILVHMVLNPRDRTREDILALAGVPVLAELSSCPGQAWAWIRRDWTCSGRCCCARRGPARCPCCA